MEFGADGYITKPFSIELLLARIDNLLTQRRKLFEKFSSQSARNKVVELAVEDVVVTDRDEEFMKNVMAWLGENIENSELTIDRWPRTSAGPHDDVQQTQEPHGQVARRTDQGVPHHQVETPAAHGQFSVSEVAYKVGFSDPGYFSRCFREQYHMSPAEYLKTHNLKQEDTKTA